MAEVSDTSSTSAPQHEPDHANPHPAWFANLVRVEDAVEGASDEVMNQLVSLADDLADRIATTPATTRAGVIAQLQLFIRCYAGGGSDIADQALDPGFLYTGAEFEFDAPSGAGLATITSRTFTKTGQLNVVQVGFDLDRQNQQVDIISVILEVLDATTNTALATCIRTDIAIGSPTCFGVTSPLIVDGASIKIRFTIIYNNTAPQSRLISFDNFRQAGANATLPVKFVSLSAKQSAAGTLLTWKVAEEDGVASYEVEKGTNGKNFSKIGAVNATGNSTYTFTDASSAPVSFYRIKSVDVDGKFGYSTIISLKNGKEVVTMKVYPMPAQRKITVQHAMTSNNAKLLISTGDGRLVKSVIPAVGSMQTEVELSNFKAGLYILSFENGNGTKETIKFIKN